jgi:fibronectin-binding autotransporter adhesin
MKKSHAINSTRRRAAATVGIGVALATFTVVSALGADKTWDGGGDGVSWSGSPANWDLDTAPVANDRLFFGGTTGLAPNNDFPAETDFAGITFNADAGAFVLSGNEVDLAAGAGVTNNSANTQVISHNVDNNGANKVHNADAGPIHYLGALKANQIVKEGTNIVVLGGALDNPSLGATVNNGTLILAKTANRAIGSTVTINTNGTVRIQGPITDQIHFNQRIILNGGVFQIQNTNGLINTSFEEVGSVSGSNVLSVIENGLANSTNRLDIGGGSAHEGIYGGSIRDGAAGVLNLRVYRHDNKYVFNGTHTYSGTTEVQNNTGALITRMILNGSHVGGAAYTISSSQASPSGAALGGTGVISAAVMNFNASSYLSPGGALSADLTDSATFSETTGTLTISNAVNLNAATATLDVQLNGTTAGLGYDQVVIAGSGSFSNNGANLKLSLGFTPANGDKFTIVRVQGTDSATNVGVFATLNGVATDLSQGAVFVEPGSGKNIRISYRAEGTTFDAGAGAGNDIMLEVVAPVGGQNLTWRGDVNNAWDIGGTANWRAAGNIPSVYSNGDFITFDDSGSNGSPVDLTTGVTPSTFLVDATKNYVLAGAGRLTGTVVMTKTNTGTISIVTDNDNVGSTIINQGTVEVGTNGITGSLSGNVSVNANGILSHRRSDDVTLALPLSGTGAFVHTGDGALILSGDSPFSGRSTNIGGVLQLGTGVGSAGSIGGDVHVSGTNVLRYFYAGDVNIGNTKSGNGTVIYEAASGNRTFNLSGNVTNINFSGSNVLTAGVRLHAADFNGGYSIGNGGSVYVSDLAQVWLDRSATAYNQEFFLTGNGFTADTTPLGAMRIFNCTVSGPVTLLADSRIGGSINGGTILGQVTGNYQLEVLGNVNSFVLSLGPTNGPNTYASTLVTSGAIRALNSGGISAGPLTLDLTGQIEVFGNNVSVASLNNGVNGAGSVYNMSTAAAGSLIVGSDGSSTSFDGVFGDGSTRPLGLTKVGAGTLTLTGVNTNTGTVAVNEGTLALNEPGSFVNSALITVASGAVLDVLGRSDQTLGLNNGQTLAGSGTVNGNVTAGPGSVVNPGTAVGTLNVSGNLTLAGTLRLELNRTNTPNNSDRLNVSGSTTYGGLLAVTNVGPALQVNDTFQLFSTGVGGFSGITIATTDANGDVYTWQNDVATLGSIKVLSVSSAVNTTPTNIVSTRTGGTLDLSWPLDHTGWRLQTNAVSLTDTNFWFDYPGSTGTNNIIISIDPSRTNVFFRLVYP